MFEYFCVAARTQADGLENRSEQSESQNVILAVINLKKHKNDFRYLQIINLLVFLPVDLKSFNSGILFKMYCDCKHKRGNYHFCMMIRWILLSAVIFLDSFLDFKFRNVLQH